MTCQSLMRTGSVSMTKSSHLSHLSHLSPREITTIDARSRVCSAERAGPPRRRAPTPRYTALWSGLKRHLRAETSAGGRGQRRHRMRSAVGMLAQTNARTGQQRLVRLLQLRVVVEGLIVDDLANARLHC